MPAWRRTGAAVLLGLIVVAGAGCATASLVESIEALLRQAKELLDARRWDEALAKVGEVVRRDPAQWKAYLYGAQAYLGKLDWGRALAQARKALELAPQEGEVVATLARSLFGAGVDALRQGAYADALGHLAEYVRLRPADLQGYLQAGRAALGARQWTEAGRYLTDGLARASDAATRTELARALLEGGRQALGLGDARGAAALLREYVRTAPTDVGAYLDLGKASWSAGDRGEALSAFRRVLELAPQNEEARRFLLGR